MSNDNIEPVLANYSVPDTQNPVDMQEAVSSVEGGCELGSGALWLAGLAAITVIIVAVMWYRSKNAPTQTSLIPSPFNNRPASGQWNSGQDKWGNRWGRNANDQPATWRDNHAAGYPDGFRAERAY